MFPSESHPPTSLALKISEHHGYDALNLDGRIIEIIRETDNEHDFHYWLSAALRLEQNRMRNTPENQIDFEATYIIEASTFGGKPGYEMKLVISEHGQSGTDYSGADVSVDWLSVHAEEIKIIVPIGEQLVEFVRQQNELGIFPTRKDVAAALKRSMTDIHNTLVEVLWREKRVQPVPGSEDGLKVVVGEPTDPAALFRAADTAEKRRLLTTTTDVYSVKAMLATLTHSGPLSPSSNVPDALHQIMGDTPCPAVIGEATQLLSNELGRMWAYSGD